MNVLPATLPKTLAEDFPWWAEVQPPRGFAASIDDILPRAENLSNNMDLWGDECGDTATVCYADNKKQRVEWIGFRLDVENLSPRLVQAICNFAKQLGCVLLTSDNQVLVPQGSKVLVAIKELKARK